MECPRLGATAPTSDLVLARLFGRPHPADALGARGSGGGTDGHFIHTHVPPTPTGSRWASPSRWAAAVLHTVRFPPQRPRRGDLADLARCAPSAGAGWAPPENGCASVAGVLSRRSPRQAIRPQFRRPWPDAIARPSSAAAGARACTGPSAAGAEGRPCPSCSRRIAMPRDLSLGFAGLLRAGRRLPSGGAGRLADRREGPADAGPGSNRAPGLRQYLGRVARCGRRQMLYRTRYFPRFFDLPRTAAAAPAMSAGTGVSRRRRRAGLIPVQPPLIEGGERFVVTLRTGAASTAERIGSDPATDFALLRMEADGSLTALRSAIPTISRVGDFASRSAIPSVLGQTRDLGIVSGLGRSGSQARRATRTSSRPMRRSQPGHSGGALVTLDGRLNRVNTADRRRPPAGMSGSALVGRHRNGPGPVMSGSSIEHWEVRRGSSVLAKILTPPGGGARSRVPCGCRVASRRSKPGNRRPRPRVRPGDVRGGRRRATGGGASI